MLQYWRSLWGLPPSHHHVFFKDAVQFFPLPGASEWVLFTVARRVRNGDVPLWGRQVGHPKRKALFDYLNAEEITAIAKDICKQPTNPAYSQKQWKLPPL